MKRKLLLFAAFLSLIPTLKAQEETLPAGQEQLVLYDNTWTTNMGSPTSITVNEVSAPLKHGNGYTSTSTTGYLFNTPFNHNQTSTSSLTSTVYNFGMQNGGSIEKKDLDNPSDKVQLIASIKFYPPKQKSTSDKTIANYRHAMVAGKVTGHPQELKVRAVYGKIHKVIFYTGTFSGTSTTSAPNKMTAWTPKTPGVIHKTPERTNDFAKVTTTVSDANMVWKNEYDCGTEGVGELVITPGSTQLELQKVVVVWSPGTVKRPDPVSPEKCVFTNGTLDKTDGNWTIYYRAAKAGIRPSTQSGVEMVMGRVFDNSAPTELKMEPTGKAYIAGSNTEIGNADLYTAGTTAANQVMNLRYGLLPIYNSINSAAILPRTRTDKTYEGDTILRLYNWNPAGYSDPVDIHIKRLPNLTPAPYEAMLPADMKYDPDTRTLTYTEFPENKTLNIPIYAEYATGCTFRYSTNGTAIGTGTTITTGNTAGTVVIKDGRSYINVPYTMDMPPVKGQKFRIKARWSNGAWGPETEIIVKYDGEDDSSDEPKPVVAPNVDVDATNSHASVGTGGIINFINSLTFNVSANRDVPEGETATFQYQLHGANASGTWTQAPEGKWETVTDNKIEINKTGRLFVRETPAAGGQANYTYRDVELISATATDLGLNGITDGQVITLKESDGYVITGKYETVMPNSDTGTPSGTKFVYIADKQGRAIKMIIEGNSNEAIFNSYEAGLGLNDITGVVRGIETGLPELWITTSAMDYAPFLPGVTINPSFTAENKTVTEISRADFNKKVVLRGVTFDKADNLFITATGATVKPYARLLTTPDFSTIIGLNENVTYSVEGFVGNANGDMVLLPTGAIATPKLLAPNPITASAEDESNGYITVNVVSDLVEITPDTEGVRTGTSLIYSINGGEEQTLPEINTTPAKIAITAADYDTDGKCVLIVKYRRENITGETVEIHLKKHDAVTVASIAEFKEKYPGETETNDDIYYRYTGNALVRAITPQYLYLRDMPADGTEFTKDELSDHSILLYNENGWEAKVAMKVRDDEAPRALKTGDIITGFAFKADRTHLKNLRGDATGFTRTLRREPATEMEYEPQTKDVLTENTAFTEADRMVRFEIKNVYVKQTVIDPDEYDDDLKRHRYTLDMDGAPELNIGDIFVLRKGWSTAYDAGSRYDIDGVVIRNGADDKYAVAMIDFTFSDKTEALSTPVLAIEGEDADATSFLKTAKIVMTSAEGADIWYTTDKSDPRRSSSRVKYSDPLEISATTTVKAFASKPGEIPSDMIETEFTRAANDRRFIVNFLDQAEAGVPYHFSGTARVAAKGGEYIFVRGTQGHYLPIHIDDPALLATINEDDYVSDFVMEPHIINTDDAAIVRGAHITADYAPLFSTPSATKPSTLTSDIQYEPDVVTTITAANARRYVKIMGVRLIGTEFEAEADDAASHDTEWKLTTDKGEGTDIPVNHNILTPTFNWDEADQTAAAYYNITGFAMLGDDGGIELWPLEVEKVRSSEPVVPSFTGNITVNPVTADGLTTVEFYPYTTVKLECPIADPKSATIYYYVSTDGKTPAADAKWNVYAQDFVIKSDSYITMYATAPGYEQSAYTHIDAKLGTPAGTVAFDVTPAPGKTTVKMTAAEGAKIFYTTDNSIAEDQWTPYTDAIEFTDDATMLWAYAKEGVKKGAVSSMYVMVMPEETQKPVDPSDPSDPSEPTDPSDPSDPSEPEQPADRISGRLNFKLTDDGNGAVRVDISPADQLEEGKYEIWYTTKTGVVLPDGGTKYEGAFEMKESGLVMAVLVEKATGKPAGQTCEVAVWVVPSPTAIDSIGADGDDNVKVDGNSIIAPEGSVVYDLTGRRVAATDLRTGIYIVRTPGGKSVKVRVD